MKNFSTHFWTRFTGDTLKKRIAFVEPSDEGVEVTTFWEWTRRIQKLAIALLEEGFEPGTRMGLIARTSRDWYDLAFATWMAGGCVVPLVPGRTRAETLRCLARSGTEWIAVDHESALVELRGQGGKLPDHLKWISLDPLSSKHRDNVFDLDALDEVGRYRAQRGAVKELAKVAFEIEPSSAALILFDPESSDDPHGAFYSSGRLAVMLEYLGGDLFADEAEETLAVLLNNGWFHAFLVSVATLLRGQRLAVADGLRELSEQLDRLSPTTLLCGPAFIEAHTAEWRERIEHAPDFLTEEDGNFGFKNALSRIGEKAAQRVLYDPIRSDMGGALERIYLVGGRAPEEVLDILENARMPALGLWGLPEAGVSHVERPGARRRGSVGRPIEGYVCKIDGAKAEASGEILLRSDTLFEGYWDERGPREIVDGYLHSGIEGHLKSGFLFVE